MANNIAEIFSLQGLHVHIIATTNTTITLHAKSARRTADCFKCGLLSHRVHQYHRRTVNHGYLHNKLILVQLTVRRFKCSSCSRPFTEQLPGITRRLSTSHCLTKRLQDAAALSLRSVAERNGVAPASVLHQLDGLRYEIPWEGLGKTIYLGIDEHSLRRRRQMVTTVTSLKRGKRGLLTILPNDRKDTLVKFLKQIPLAYRSLIWEVCIDMRGSFRAAIEDGLPSARIVVDPFHLVKLAGEKLEDVRSVVLSNLGEHTPKVKRTLRTPREKLTDTDQEKLTKLWTLVKPWPHLKLSWQVKEKIRDLYRSQNRRNAEKKFVLILAYLAGVESRPLKELRRTLLRWQPYILNHFDHGTSNGFTEGCHTKIKMLKRLSYGFKNRARYRTKILLAFHPPTAPEWSTLN